MDLLLVNSCLAERALIAEALRGLEGIRVKEAANGKEAAASLTIATPHAIICREHMDDVRCTQLIRMVRDGVFGYTQTPIIVLAERPELLKIATPPDANTFYLEVFAPRECAHQIKELIARSPRPSVLFIEDNAAYAQQCSALLSSQFEITVCSDGAAGLQTWIDQRQAVVLLDLMLPSMSGEQILDSIRRIEPKQPIVILTAYDHADKHKELVLAGASAFLSKGVDPTKAANTINDVLRESDIEGLTLQADRRESKLRDLTNQVHSAHYNLTRGRAGLANVQLSDAMKVNAALPPSDDEWMQLLSDRE